MKRFLLSAAILSALPCLADVEKASGETPKILDLPLVTPRAGLAYWRIPRAMGCCWEILWLGRVRLVLATVRCLLVP
jgi:hypothetical protein